MYNTTKYIAIAPKTLCYTFCSNSSDFLFGCHWYALFAEFFDYSYNIGVATKSGSDENDAIIIINNYRGSDENDAIIIINNYRVSSYEYVCVCVCV